MDHIPVFVLVHAACESHSIVTDATGSMQHYMFCYTHQTLVPCADETCAFCLRFGITHGDHTET